MYCLQFIKFRQVSNPFGHKQPLKVTLPKLKVYTYILYILGLSTQNHQYIFWWWLLIFIRPSSTGRIMVWRGLSVCLSVRPSVCLSVHFLIVHAITFDPLKISWRYFIHTCTITRRSVAYRFHHPHSKVMVNDQIRPLLVQAITFDPHKIVSRHFIHTCTTMPSKSSIYQAYYVLLAVLLFMSLLI
jgi:hypothetical protein